MSEHFKTHITGISGYGKSYFTKNVFIPAVSKHKPTIIFDRKGEYGGPGAKDIPKKWKAFNGFNDFMEALRTPKDSGGLGMIIDDEPYVIVCREDADYTDGIRFFHALSQPVILVFEEVHDLLNDPDYAEAKKRIIKIARHGRHEGIDIALISQRSGDVSTDIRSQFTSFITFRQTLESDVLLLKQTGCPDYRKIVELEKENYLSWGEIPKQLNKALKK